MSIKDMFKTRAAKRQVTREIKASGKSEDELAFRAMLEKNADMANETALSFFKALSTLGFTIEGYLQFSEDGITPKCRVYPMTLKAYKEYIEQATLKPNDQNDDATNGEGSGTLDPGLAKDEGVLGAESPLGDDAEALPK